MKNSAILIVTEANEKVASGHLFESIVCYNELRKHMSTVYLMVNGDIPIPFKEKLPDVYSEYNSDVQAETAYFIQYVIENNIDIIIFNLRKIENEFIIRLRKELSICIICIDEFGHRALEADVIINPMISDYYWNYDSKATLYFGSQYLILPPSLVKFHEMDKKINDTIQTVTVSLGGIDAYGTTLKIAQWLPDLWPHIHLNLVLGGGFQYKEELFHIIEGKNNISIYQNINFLYRLFYESDLAICAGGNTLHELAAIGTPAIVIPSMPHEVQNGQTFQKKGFSICCKITSEIEKENFIQNLKPFTKATFRRKMSMCGKRISDGKGYERVCNIIQNRVYDKKSGNSEFPTAN